MVFSSSSKDPIASFLGLCDDPTIFMACDCTAFTAREIGFPERSVGFLRGGMVAFF
jgi:hypothetical protein